MSVFLSDKDTAKFDGNYVMFNKLAVRALSSLKHSASSRVLNLIKHSCSFIKHYITTVEDLRIRDYSAL